MATPAQGLNQFDPKKDSHVGIQEDLLNSNNLAVSRQTFRVTENEPGLNVAEWFCHRNHNHSENGPCFTIKFDKKQGSPFQSTVFPSDANGYACSDKIKVKPGNTVYKYTVESPNKRRLDPQGVVKP
jgi:hypothetical protein